MKKTAIKHPEKRTHFMLIMLSIDPEREDQSSQDSPYSDDDETYDAESQEINKDPIIGGADDVHRENTSDDLLDSDLVDQEPLQDETERVQQIPETPVDKDLDEPYDADEEDEEISNLEDTQDLMGEESEIDDETTI